MKKGLDSRAKTSATRIQALKTRQKCVDLRLSGKTIPDIAASLNLSPSTVHSHLVGAMESTRSDIEGPAIEIKEIEVARLDRLLVSIWPAATSGDVFSVDRALKIMERRARLLGLDAPVRQESTGKDGGPIEHSHRADLTRFTDAELEEIERITAAAAARGPSGTGAPPA